MQVSGESISGSPAPGTPVHGSGFSAPDASAVQPRWLTRLQKGVTQHLNYRNISKYGLVCSTDEQAEPRTLDEAFGDERWRKAMMEEYMALKKNKTWHLVPPRQGKNLIDCKWVFRVKRKLMEPLIDTRLGLLQKVLSKCMGWTMKIPLVQ